MRISTGALLVYGRRTKVQVPRRTTTTEPERSGVLSGRALQASSTTVVSLLVAKTGRVPLIGRGNVAKYVIGSCATPCTVAFCKGITVLSRLATDIALMAFPGLDVYHEPLLPSLPRRIVQDIEERDDSH